MKALEMVVFVKNKARIILVSQTKVHKLVKKLANNYSAK